MTVRFVLKKSNKNVGKVQNKICNNCNHCLNTYIYTTIIDPSNTTFFNVNIAKNRLDLQTHTNTLL